MYANDTVIANGLTFTKTNDYDIYKPNNFIVNLNKGPQKLKAEITGGWLNLDRVLFYQTDSTPPSAPVLASAESIGITAANLFWAPSTDNLYLYYYNVYANGKQIKTVQDTSVALTGLLPNESFEVYVTAVDIEGNESEASNIQTFVTLSDTVPPWHQKRRTCLKLPKPPQP
ncbi:MAG: fibronectin type III domain-containing protein [Bacteroidales bacterium]|nr:fibronectin type III domain-containing protein [Bacteroidales bacterium]